MSLAFICRWYRYKLRVLKRVATSESVLIENDRWAYNNKIQDAVGLDAEATFCTVGITSIYRKEISIFRLIDAVFLNLYQII